MHKESADAWSHPWKWIKVIGTLLKPIPPKAKRSDKPPLVGQRNGAPDRI